MCLILLAYQVHPDYPLIIAANRDEFHARPSAFADFWEDTPTVLGGRDLQSGGTWLGITRQGRIATVTNYREPHYQSSPKYSRGKLVSNFLQTYSEPQIYLQRCMDNKEYYQGFNLLVGTAEQLHYYSNRGYTIQPITPGIHGLSNHLLNTPWSKVVRGKHALATLLSSPNLLTPDALLTLLNNRTKATDTELPNTGISLEWERLLSALFIVSPEYNYGTCCSTVVLIRSDGQVTFLERSFSVEGVAIHTVKHQFTISYVS